MWNKTTSINSHAPSAYDLDVGWVSAELALQAAEFAPADFREEDVSEKPSKVHP